MRFLNARPIEGKSGRFTGKRSLYHLTLPFIF
jgi:hypothetical protein